MSTTTPTKRWSRKEKVEKILEDKIPKRPKSHSIPKQSCYEFERNFIEGLTSTDGAMVFQYGMVCTSTPESKKAILQRAGQIGHQLRQLQRGGESSVEKLAEILTQATSQIPGLQTASFRPGQGITSVEKGRVQNYTDIIRTELIEVGRLFSLIPRDYSNDDKLPILSKFQQIQFSNPNAIKISATITPAEIEDFKKYLKESFIPELTRLSTYKFKIENIETRDKLIKEIKEKQKALDDATTIYNEEVARRPPAVAKIENTKIIKKQKEEALNKDKKELVDIQNSIESEIKPFSQKLDEFQSKLLKFIDSEEIRAYFKETTKITIDELNAKTATVVKALNTLATGIEYIDKKRSDMQTNIGRLEGNIKDLDELNSIKDENQKYEAKISLEGEQNIFAKLKKSLTEYLTEDEIKNLFISNIAQQSLLENKKLYDSTYATLIELLKPSIIALKIALKIREEYMNSSSSTSVVTKASDDINAVKIEKILAYNFLGINDTEIAPIKDIKDKLIEKINKLAPPAPVSTPPSGPAPAGTPSVVIKPEDIINKLNEAVQEIVNKDKPSILENSTKIRSILDEIKKALELHLNYKIELTKLIEDMQTLLQKLKANPAKNSNLMEQVNIHLTSLVTAASAPRVGDNRVSDIAFLYAIQEFLEEYKAQVGGKKKRAEKDSKKGGKKEATRVKNTKKETKKKKVEKEHKKKSKK